MEYPDRIEEFSTEQMKDYLTKYPRGMKADALQHRLVQCLSHQEILDMLQDSNPIIPKAILNAQKEEFEKELHSVIRQPIVNTKTDEKKQKNTTYNITKEETNVVVGGDGDKTMEIVGRVFLSLLVIAGAFGIIYLVFFVFNIKQHSLVVPFWAACVVPLLKSIWS